MEQRILVVFKGGEQQIYMRRDLRGMLLDRLASEGAMFFCMCLVGVALQMYKHGHGQNARLHRNPETGDLHECRCPSHEPFAGIGQGGGTRPYRPAIEQVADKIDVKLNLSLSDTVADPDIEFLLPTVIRKRAGTPDMLRASTGLTGFAQHLFDRSGLNIHVPGKPVPKDANDIARRLGAVTRMTQVNGRALDDVLLMPRYDNQPRIAGMVASRTPSPSSTGKGYLLLLGEIRGIDSSGEYTRLPLHFSDLDLRASPGLWREALATSDYPFSGTEHVRRLISEGNARVMAFARVEAEGTSQRFGRPVPRVRAKNLALMVVSRQGIRVESGYELLGVMKGVDEARHFTKPTYPSFGLKNIPDLVLHDTVIPTACEILGSNDPDYLEAALAKIPELDRSFGTPTWVWHAYRRGEPIPPFPPRKK